MPNSNSLAYWAAFNMSLMQWLHILTYSNIRLNTDSIQSNRANKLWAAGFVSQDYSGLTQILYIDKVCFKPLKLTCPLALSKLFAPHSPLQLPPPTNSTTSPLQLRRGARWLSGRVSDSGARGLGFETYCRRVVSLSKILYSPKVLVNYPGNDGSVPTWLKNCWLGR